MRPTGPYRDDGALSPFVALVLGAAAAGLVLGLALGFTGAVSLVGEPQTIAAAATAPYGDCPASDPAGVFHRGDRVLATARSEDAAWVQVRSPRSTDERVWIRSADLEPDADLSGLPVLPCGVAVEVITETTTTTSSTSTTSTTVLDTTTTTLAATTTTLPPPAVTTVTVTNNPIWEGYNGEDFCLGGPGQPTRTVVSASVTAAAGVQSVTLLWSVGGESGSIAMTLSSGQYRATLGPFDAENPDGVPQDQSLPITVTVRVVDDLDRTATKQTTVTLEDCTFI
jgi:hypothetical protein